MELRVDAMIGGVEKGGTTSLGRYLADHPGILSHLGPGARMEDIEFSPFVTEDSRDPIRFREAFLKAFGRRPSQGELVLGKSVGIFHLPEAARQLHRHNSGCLLILSLRNPVDRAYSAYWYQRYRGEEDAATFEEAIELERAREEEGIWSPHRMYLGKGRYAQHLQRLRQLFGSDQIHVLLLEDLKERPTRTVHAVYDFLGVESHPVGNTVVENRARMTRWPWLAQLVQQDGVAKALVRHLVPEALRIRLWRWIRTFNAVEKRPPPMSDQTRQRLVEYFRPYNRQLEQLLERDLSRWNR